MTSLKNTLFIFIFISLSSLNASGTQSFDEAYKNLNDKMLREDIKVLSSDEFEGRAPATEGEIKTINYLRDRFKSMGLEPVSGNSYFQSVPLVEMEADRNMVLSISGKTYSYDSQFVAWTKRITEKVVVKDSDLVFVGYGIVAPEYQWNDYHGVDVKGKTVVMLVNDPGYATQDEQLFNGNAMTYYGRWTYKYEEAARQGAAGVLLVHQTAPASYPWGVIKGFTGPQFDLVTKDNNMSRTPMEAWITLDVAEELFKRAGLNFREQEKAALSRDFKALAMDLKASIEINNKIKKSYSNNVAAVVKGSKSPDEYIIYTAHWDHMGVNPTLEGDQIFNGAIDNASGTAALLTLAQSFMDLKVRPERSIIFLAVTAEEKGLLGSAYYSQNPLVPTAKTIAGINMDALKFAGPMSDMTVVGFGKSELEEYARRAALKQGRELVAEANPEAGMFYRSDHFNFAKYGIPMLYARGGTTHRELGEKHVITYTKNYYANNYHKPSDEYNPDWDFRGIVEDLQVYFHIGHELATSDAMPNWYKSAEFRITRDKDLKSGN
ncbi:MAG: peptidase M28 [Gammaproteobacteria bacterium]|nr:MAG: peptidase M28 [Gammaproteobacteria bacterium]PCJ48431.1 MAG: peptidase M28 [Gammaproteobacteria bacterium]